MEKREPENKGIFWPPETKRDPGMVVNHPEVDRIGGTSLLMLNRRRPRNGKGRRRTGP